MDFWTYLPLGVALVAGVLSAFFSRDGAVNKIRGVGWVLVSLAILSGGLSIYIQIRKDRAGAAAKVAEAEARKAEALLRAENRQLQLRSVALGLVNLAGLNLSKPLESATFQLHVGRQEEGDRNPNPIPGFIGPFPSPGAGKGLFTLELPEMFYFLFELTTQGDGDLRIRALDGSQTAAAILRPSAGEDVFATAGGENGPGWSSGGEDGDFSYDLHIDSALPTRAVIARLAEATTFGTLELHIPGTSEADKKRIALAYTMVKPSLVLAPPQMEADPDGGCVTRIRVPMDVIRVEDPNPDRLVFRFSAAPEGFNNEICGWVP